MGVSCAHALPPMLAALAALALLVQPDTTVRPAPAPADTVETEMGNEVAGDEVTDVVEDVRRWRVRPVLSPTTFYSPSRGVGIGGGVVVDDVLSRGDRLHVEGRLAQRLQGAFGEYLTADPLRARLYGHFGGAAWTTSRTRFVGHGPSSPADAELFLDRASAEAEARLGWAPGPPGRVLIEPVVRARYDRLRGYEETQPGELDEVTAEDLARLNALRGEDRYGAELGLIGVYDGRDLPTMPSRGVYLQGEAARFEALDGSGLGFTRVQALGYAFRPALLRLPFIPDRGALFVRANGVVTRQDGDRPLPWVYLPVLDGDLLVGYPRSDYVGRDAFSVSVGARGVIGEAIGAFLFEGIASATIGAAYDDVLDQFTPRLQFTDTPPAPGEAVPLKPSVAVGMNLRFIDRERAILGGLVGVGPGGLSLATLRLVYGLGDYRPRLR